MRQNDEIVEGIGDRIEGRTAGEAVLHPVTEEVLAEEGELISPAVAMAIEEAGVQEVEVRSVLTCESRQGVCAKCYGKNLATNRPVQTGEAVGVIAAQSIGSQERS